VDVFSAIFANAALFELVWLSQRQLTVFAGAVLIRFRVVDVLCAS
jgi:hypothetical protein